MKELMEKEVTNDKGLTSPKNRKSDSKAVHQSKVVKNETDSNLKLSLNYLTLKDSGEGMMKNTSKNF